MSNNEDSTACMHINCDSSHFVQILLGNLKISKAARKTPSRWTIPDTALFAGDESVDQTFPSVTPLASHDDLFFLTIIPPPLCAQNDNTFAMEDPCWKTCISVTASKRATKTCEQFVLILCYLGNGGRWTHVSGDRNVSRALSEMCAYCK